MSPAEAALLSARATVAQLEAIVAAEGATYAEDVPDGTTLCCPGCKSVSVKQLEKNFDELWRIKCQACGQVWKEPIVEASAEGSH